MNSVQENLKCLSEIERQQTISTVRLALGYSEEELEKLGVSKVFTPGALTEEAINFLKETISSKGSDEKIM